MASKKSVYAKSAPRQACTCGDAGQSHEGSNEAEQVSAVEIGSSGDEPAGLDATLTLDRIEANEIEDNVFQDCEIVSGIAGTGPHLVVTKDHIHAPMQAVLDRPM